MARVVCRVLLVVALLLAAPAWAGQGRDQEARPTVTVTGRAVLHKAADEAVLRLGMVSLAPTAAEAAERNSRLTAQVRAALKDLLGQGDRLETAGYDLSAQTQWDEAAKVNRVTGYRAAHTLRLTSADPQSLGRALDAAVGAGANEIDGPTWRLADEAAARIEAQAAALQDASAQARALAKAAGLRLAGLLSADAAGQGGAAPVARLAMAAPRAAAPPTQLTPGRIAVEASVTCTFALTR
ncbi:protein of unknown function DUF541 [Desulfarculus baarsii DSM 2075]|uniref:DUF541 domain-containing protein n=1 Tax=Desulfarculus baarsii (strain ATCC 33931 / DSM 2075 / LMG 7858 / VKM B-1802 / 2st14) TaxID=644282 RepID=E1QEY5_DESB2|nr:SIMPL domain-containing protein [Desulfarculus baarsii]ADK84121.1 protein of unknown function DUF541 [Desulfarculus baarsii DSM 2075]